MSLLDAFGTAFESMRDSIAVTTPELEEPGPTLVYVNPAFTRMTGYDASEVIGANPRLFQGPDTSRAVLEACKTSLRATGYFQGQVVNYRKDGSPYDIDWRISPHRDPSGSIAFFVAIQRELAPRALGNALPASDDLALLHTSPDPSVVLTSVGSVLHANQAFADLLGHERASLEGASVRALLGLPRDDQNPGIAEDERARLPALPERWFRIRGRAWSPELGARAMVIQEVSEQEARANEARQSLHALDQWPRGVLLLGEDRRILFLNPCFKRLCECPSLYVGDRWKAPLIDRMPREASQAIARAQAAAFAGGQGSETIILGDGPDRRHLSVKSFGLPGEDVNGRHVLLEVSDDTEQRRSADVAESVRTHGQLGRLFASLRYELGNPVNSLKMALTVLRQNLRSFDATMVENYVQRSLGDVARVEELLAQLRSVGFVEPPTRELLDVGEACQQILPRLQELAPGRISLLVPSEKTPVACEEKTIEQILRNLVTNARDSLEGIAQGQITIRVAVGRALVVLSVEDNGPGMEQSKKEEVFIPFSTTKAKGSGLGLVIVQKLVGQLGGTIRCESAIGKGTAFFLELPLVSTAKPKGE